MPGSPNGLSTGPASLTGEHCDGPSRLVDNSIRPASRRRGAGPNGGPGRRCPPSARLGTGPTPGARPPVTVWAHRQRARIPRGAAAVTVAACRSWSAWRSPCSPGSRSARRSRDTTSGSWPRSGWPCWPSRPAAPGPAPGSSSAWSRAWSSSGTRSAGPASSSVSSRGPGSRYARRSSSRCSRRRTAFLQGRGPVPRVRPGVVGARLGGPGGPARPHPLRRVPLGPAGLQPGRLAARPARRARRRPGGHLRRRPGRWAAGRRRVGPRTHG